MEQENKKCDVCHGEGYTSQYHSYPCNKCKGKGYVEISTLPSEVTTEDTLQDEFMNFWDSKKESLGLGNYSDDITDFWIKKINSVREEAKREVLEDLLKYLPFMCRENLKDYEKEKGINLSDNKN